VFRQTSGKEDFDLIFRPLAPDFSVHCKRSQPLNMTASKTPVRQLPFEWKATPLLFSPRTCAGGIIIVILGPIFHRLVNLLHLFLHIGPPTQWRTMLNFETRIIVYGRNTFNCPVSSGSTSSLFACRRDSC
jgi:hypothetical protein